MNNLNQRTFSRLNGSILFSALEMMIPLVYFALLFTQTTSLPNLRPLISRYLDFPGHFFFCDVQDAASTLHNQGNYINANIFYGNTNFNLIAGHLQSVGIFLDLSCEEGYDFLNQNLDSFNGTYRWLIWSEDVDRTLEILRPSRLSVDSDVILATTGIRIYDLFRMHRSLDIERVQIGDWSDEKFEMMPRPPRDDFKQFTFNASLMMTTIKFNLSNLIPPLLDSSHEFGVDALRRYGLSVHIQLAQRYNFRMNYILTRAWGSFINGSWTGMVGQVVQGEAEFGLSPAKFVVERMGVIDFITSISIVKVCFTFLQPTLFGTYKALVLPLDPIVWACLGACSIIGVITFIIVSKYDRTSSCNDNVGGSLLMVLSSIAQQGFPDNSQKLSTRIIYISLLFVTFFTAVYYNTAILNGLLLQSPNAIQNIDQLLKSDIDLAILEGPYMRNEINAYNDTHTIQIRKKLAKIKDPKKRFLRVEEAVQRMKKGKFAYYTEEKVVYAEISKKMSDAEICSLSEIQKYRPFHCGAFGQKNSPYKETFRRGFTLMREAGLIKRTQDHWFAKKPECHWKQDMLSLGLEPLTLAYFVLILGYILALIAFYFERSTKQPKPPFFKQKGEKTSEKLNF